MLRQLLRLLVTVPLLLAVIPIQKSRSQELPRGLEIDRAGITQYEYYFPNLPPSAPVTVVYQDVGYKRNVRANQCGIIEIAFPKAFAPANPSLHHTLALFQRSFSWSSGGEETQPTCNGSEYVGPKWVTSGGFYYLWRKGNKVKLWWSSFTPYQDNTIIYFTDEYANTLERKVKANPCGVAKLKSQLSLATGYSGSSYIYWPVSTDNPWTVNGVSHTQDPLENPGQYLCKNGVLYK